MLPDLFYGKTKQMIFKLVIVNYVSLTSSTNICTIYSVVVHHIKNSKKYKCQTVIRNKFTITHKTHLRAK